MTQGQGSGAHGEPGNPEGSGSAQPPSQGYPPAEGYPPAQGYPGQGYPPAPGYPPPGQSPAGGWPPTPPPYPGYGPAPSAPQGYGAPPHLERPTSVVAGTVAFIAYVVLGLIASAIQFSNTDELVRRAMTAAGNQNNAQLTEQAARNLVVVGAVIGLIFVALECMFIWFAWNGRNWARIVLWVIGGLNIVSGVIALGSSSYLSGFLQGLSVCEFLLVLAGVVLLAQKSANEWYRYRKWQRATGQG